MTDQRAVADNQPTTTSQPRATWLQSLMLRDAQRWSGRLALAAARLRQMKIGQQRRLRRLGAAGAASVAGLALVAVLSGPMAPPVAANGGTTITVDNTTCTLIDAIKAANTNAAVAGSDCTPGTGDDVIELAANVTVDTTFLTFYYTSRTGLPLINSKMTIDGNGFEISRSPFVQYFRVMAIGSSGDLTLTDTTMKYGTAYYQNGNHPQTMAGGALYNKGTATLENVTISNSASRQKGAAIGNAGQLTLNTVNINTNVANAQGGGVFQTGATSALTMTNSVVTGNTGDRGGGVYIGDGSFYISDSQITTNTSSESGGGMYVDGGPGGVITGTLISGNRSQGDPAYGGGIYFYADGSDTSSLTIINSTISTNSAEQQAGGIWFGYGTLDISGSTINGNYSAGTGGAISTVTDSVITISDTIINGNTAAGDHYEGNGGAINMKEAGLMTISGSTLNNNEAYDYGGAIYAQGTVTITDSTISNNSAVFDGGGIYHLDGTLTISNTVISDNYAGDDGGGVYFYGDGVSSALTIVNSTISNNEGYYNAGGLLIAYATFTIDSSTIANNEVSEYGGGVYLYAYAYGTIVNSTISGNTADQYGGAFYLDEYNTLGLYNSTVTDNYAYAGSAIQTYENNTVTIAYSIVSGNYGREISNGDASNTFTTISNTLGSNAVDSTEAFYNFIPSASDFVATSDSPDATALEDILDTTLADNGGPTLTHNLVAGSPAIDFISGSSCDPATDQRGVARPVGDGCDAGAVEYEPPPVCSAEGRNWVRNGDFERQQFWRFFNEAKNGGRLRYVKVDPFEGMQNLQVTVNQKSKNIQVFNEVMGLFPRTTYVVCLTAKSSDGRDASLLIHKNVAPFTSYTSARMVMDLTEEWQTFEFEFTTRNIKEFVNDARLRLWLSPYAANGTVYEFDDFIVSQKGVPGR